MPAWFKHLCAWVVFASVSVIVKIAEVQWQFDWVYPIETYSKYFFAACIFYASYAIIFKVFLDQKKYFLVILGLLVLLFINGVVRHFIFSSYVHLGVFPMYSYNFSQSFTIGIWWWYQFSLLGFGYYSLMKRIDTDKKLHMAEKETYELQNRTLQLQSENLNLQNAKLIAEYNHLRAQINPHFLFNTLNTFYSNTEPVLPETAKGIMLLSDIMRYSLESGETDGKVSLREELTQLGNYVELMQLRFDGQLKIEGNLFPGGRLQWPKETQKWRILPHLLITMAENAFKHGNNREPFIINLYLEGAQLHFIFKNTIGMRKAETGTGIGLKNMIDRLGFTYNNNYRFESGITGSLYTAELYITDNAALAAQDLNLAS